MLLKKYRLIENRKWCRVYLPTGQIMCGLCRYNYDSVKGCGKEATCERVNCNGKLYNIIHRKVYVAEKV